MADTSLWEKGTSVAAWGTLVLVILGGVWNLVDEDELKATGDELKVELKASEDRLMGAIGHSTEQTNAQIQEMRGYIVNHFDGHQNDGDATN